MIKGITVFLITEQVTGYDDFGAPTVSEVEIPIDNVIVAPALSDDVTNQLSMTGRKAVYTLGIPKGDTNDWENREVRFFGRRWRSFGIPIEGIGEMIPLRWNKKVLVERYE